MKTETCHKWSSWFCRTKTKTCQNLYLDKCSIPPHTTFLLRIKVILNQKCAIDVINCQYTFLSALYIGSRNKHQNCLKKPKYYFAFIEPIIFIAYFLVENDSMCLGALLKEIFSWEIIFFICRNR